MISHITSSADRAIEAEVRQVCRPCRIQMPVSSMQTNSEQDYILDLVMFLSNLQDVVLRFSISVTIRKGPVRRQCCFWLSTSSASFKTSEWCRPLGTQILIHSFRIQWAVSFPTMAATFDELVSERQFHEVAYSMVFLASVFIIARAGIHIWKKKSMQPQDYLLYSVFVCFLAMSICYLVIIPTIYKIGRVANGLMPPWNTMAEDVVVYVRIMFFTTIFFWLSLWLVKLSLLALYKKLLTGLPLVYVQLWWAVFIFCLIVSPSFCADLLLLTNMCIRSWAV
jgi:hypothetical protein